MDTRVSIASLFVFAVAVLAPSAYGQDDAYHILLTNDDGVQSPGLQALAAALSGIGKVHVVAPCGERSGSSMAVALRDELRLRPVERNGQVLGNCVDTTPAGAVMLGITSLSPGGGFDLVVSGINRGANVGTSAHMSGTVGGAMMGAFYGIPAIAASLGAPRLEFEYSARFVAGFVEELRQRAALPGVVFSINIPRATEAEIEGVVVAKMGGAHLEFAYEEIGDGPDGKRFAPRIGFATEAPAETDAHAYLNNMISVAPLLFDWTAYSVIDDVRGWGLSPQLGR